MNIRSLTRGDGVVIGAAVLLFIASFLDLSGCDAPDPYCNAADFPNAWDSLGLGLGTYLAGVIGAVLVVLARLQPGGPRKLAGQDLGAFGTAVTVVVAWVLLWSLIDSGNAGAGLILGFLAAAVLAGAAIATPLVRALQGPLVPAQRPAAPQPYGAQPQGGYGYPGAQQPPYGGQPQPGGAQPFAGGQPQAAQPQPTQAQAPAGDFSPFWFAVPVPRPLFPEDGSPTPIAELAPGTWYLAVEQRGAQLVAQTQDGRRGVLQDTSGIQRG
ncbi:hypothetical protein C3489_31465 [Streptomyces sp. Ru71]|uniref:DUF5336 domain-containing protein n=1 Tax=Streptomyces sp. Ru71 TaxID=2080746 RepID=UPI000CDD2C5B|nr:DUF5336 domain-containing protein [Streptomyces sp. Ru71]POX46617.1 hypothetical protein C3489_31465 [Streptomyces sp. Ru71]